ncbi:hypothetical protein FOMPIDRAFT_99299 [Fomitopsis schrenkii]|uniref:F-box domain-containing protein n=1 Tax=Fomitopsis schrenkii TaxID=2126942 RepID=S8DXD1_FOMSC|nr:hypothetical protein FOMPIDRAFT_99299 [Fomitopsis schrenkii]
MTHCHTQQALSTLDILLNIFERLQFSSTSNNWYSEKAADNRATLAHAAAVCKDLHGPAVRILWRDLPTFSALVRLLPNRVVDVGCNDEKAYVLETKLDQKQWARFTYYAGFVRRCESRPRSTYCENWVGNVDPMVFSYLFMYNGHKPILPRLERLSWCQDSLVDSNWALTSLLTPSLRHLTIYLFDDTGMLRDHPEGQFAPRIHMVLDGIIHLCPALVHLGLAGAFRYRINCLPVACLQSKSLRTLDVRGVGSLEWLRLRPLLRQLAKFPALRTLHAVSDGKWPPKPPSPSLDAGSERKPRDGFPKLKTVYINGTKVDIQAFLASKAVVEALEANRSDVKA